jgi:cyanophycinase
VTSQPKGKLIIIGGHEDKENDQQILKEVAKPAHKGKLVIVTVATQEPEAIADEYVKVFKKLGVAETAVLDIRTREDAHDQKLMHK